MRISFYALLALVVAGCIPIEVDTRARSMYWAKTTPTLLYVDDGAPGDVADTIFVGTDYPPIATYGRWHRDYQGTYYLVEWDGMRYYTSDVCDSVGAVFRRQANPFRLPISEDAAAWGRATTWLTRHGDMKIQVATDNILQNYNPTKPGYRSYTVTRLQIGDSTQYEVSCTKKARLALSDYTYTFSDRISAARLAHYIETGDDLPYTE